LKATTYAQFALDFNSALMGFYNGLCDRRKVMFTHSKGDRILSMTAEVGAIAERSCSLIQRAIAFFLWLLGF
jgi:hypothetical protein